MLDYIWAFMIIAGVVLGGLRGPEIVNMVAEGALDSAKEAIELCIVMLGVVGLWNGIMNIAKEAGLISKWTKGINPAISFLFPKIPQDDEVRQDIAMNMIANMLGLGWAATPAGLRAMKGLKRLSANAKKASNEMCTLIVLNISSLQLIPVNIIAYRSRYGSANPTAVIGPGLVATTVATIVAIIFCRCMSKNEEPPKDT